MKKGWICGIIAVVLNLLLALLLNWACDFLASTGDPEYVQTAALGAYLAKFYFGLTVVNALVVFWASKKKVGSVFLIIVGVFSLMSGVGIASTILNIVAASSFNNARKMAKMEAQHQAELDAAVAAAQAEQTVEVE